MGEVGAVKLQEANVVGGVVAKKKTDGALEQILELVQDINSRQLAHDKAVNAAFAEGERNLKGMEARGMGELKKVEEQENASFAEGERNLKAMGEQENASFAEGER